MMIAPNSISAVIFDMDGTLVNSEVYTSQAVLKLCYEFGLKNTNFDLSSFTGASWESIATVMVGYYPQLNNKPGIPKRLHEIFHQLLRQNPPRPIKHARRAVICASKLMPTAVVSSSHRESVEETIRNLDIESCIQYYAGVEDSCRAKPEPDCYLRAAEYFSLEPRECLVFEDSFAGIQAAVQAGMPVIAINNGHQNPSIFRQLVQMTIRDYSELGTQFFSRVYKQNASR